MAESLSSYSKNRKSKVFAHFDFEMVLGFAIIGSNAANALKFINDVRT